MPAITIRNLPESVHAALKQRAATENLAVEALVRRLLAAAALVQRDDTMTHPAGFAEVSQPWGPAPATHRAALWGALKGSVRTQPGTDLTAPLDEAWDAAC